MAYLTISLRLYNDLQVQSYKDDASSKIRQAYDGYSKYAESYSSRYVDQRLGRAGDFHIMDVLSEVEADISVVDKWTKRSC